MSSEMKQNTTDAAQSDHSCLSFLQLACFHVCLLFTNSLIAFLPQFHQRQAWGNTALESQTISMGSYWDTDNISNSTWKCFFCPIFYITSLWETFSQHLWCYKNPGSARWYFKICACFSVCQQEVTRSPASSCWRLRTSGSTWEFIGSLISETFAGKSQETPDSQPHLKP